MIWTLEHRQQHIFEGMRTIRNSITIWYSSFAICPGAFHRVLVAVVTQEAQEVHLQVEGHLQGVLGYQEAEGGPLAHQSWVGGREVHPVVHLGLHHWGGKGGHPGGMEALNV